MRNVFKVKNKKIKSNDLFNAFVFENSAWSQYIDFTFYFFNKYT